MKKDMRKAMAPKPAKSSMKIKAKMPMDGMSAAPAGMPMGMKKGGSCGTKMAKGGSCKGYYKGGSVDGIIKKAHTKGKIC
jgi:hypothetical protein